MYRFAVMVAIALSAGCHYNEYVNQETGQPDTSGVDIPAQRLAAPQGQAGQATTEAEKL